MKKKIVIVLCLQLLCSLSCITYSEQLEKERICYQSDALHDYFNKKIDLAENYYCLEIGRVNYAGRILEETTEFNEWEYVLDLTIPIKILEDLKYEIEVEGETSNDVYPYIYYLLCKYYIEQYYEGEGNYRYNTQNRIIEILDEFYMKYEKNYRSSLCWNSTNAEIYGFLDKSLRAQKNDKLSVLQEWLKDNKR